MTLVIRPVRPGEAGLVLGFVRRLADDEKLAHMVEATEQDIETALFGPAPRVFCEVAEWHGEPVGFALWFYTFSTFTGRHGIYLEDLFVDPAHRGKGIGRALLGSLAQRCLAEGLRRLEWSVLDGNEPALAFYRSLGAEGMVDWTVFRLTGKALRRIAEREQ